MNLFVLHYNPVTAARYQCDKHVVKMILETAQLLSTAHRVIDLADDPLLYKATHINHPCAVWVRASRENYWWAYYHFTALCEEYTLRYCRIHATEDRLRKRLSLAPRLIPDRPITPFAQAMPEEYRCPDNAVQAYRTYYRAAKKHIATWQNGAPHWWDVETISPATV